MILALAGCGTKTPSEPPALQVDNPPAAQKPYVCTEAQKISTPFAGGTGASQSPFQICTIEQLKNAAQNAETSDKSFALLADLDFSSYSGSQFLIGPSGFRGVFEGNSHTISHFTLNSAGGSSIGLFSIILEGGEVRNLNLTHANIRGDSEVGILAGQSSGKIRNCKVSGQVIGETHSIGGLVGRAHKGSLIDQSSSSAEVSGVTSVGGLVGEMNEGATTGESVIQRSFSSGTVRGEGGGGLVGTLIYGTIQDSYSTTNVIGDFMAGGLVGQIEGNSATITRAYSSGSVTLSPSSLPPNPSYFGAGGLAGIFSRGTVTQSFSSGQVVNNSSAILIGGVFGSYPTTTPQNAPTSDVYWDISRSGQSTCSSSTVGGCTGVNSGNSDPNYFFTKTSAPFPLWNFTSTWEAIPNSYPTLNHGLAHIFPE
jgi:hypothetical protein